MSSERVTQARVGFFILLGLIAICAMVVYFGRFGDGLKRFYELRVEYPNASGLFAGADVLLAGAKVGAVQEGPYVLDNMRGVYVILKIYEGVQVPQGSAFTIGSSGLLGDSFVDITMPSDLDVEKFQPIAPGTTIVGKKDAGGIAELAGSGGELLEDVRKTVNNINVVVTRLNEEVLNKQSVEAVNATLLNLKATSDEFTKASQGLEQVVSEANAAMKEVGVAVGKVSKTAEKSTDTLASTKEAAEAFTKTMKDIQTLIRDIRNGRGALGVLVGDRQAAENLRALIANLRARGILWYRDRAPEPPPEREGR